MRYFNLQSDTTVYTSLSVTGGGARADHEEDVAENGDERLDDDVSIDVETASEVSINTVSSIYIVCLALYAYMSCLPSDNKFTF